MDIYVKSDRIGLECSLAIFVNAFFTITGASKSKKMKLTVKGGAAVDPDSGSHKNLALSAPFFFFFLILTECLFIFFFSVFIFRPGEQRSCPGAEWEDVQRNTGSCGHRERNQLLL